MRNPRNYRSFRRNEARAQRILAHWRHFPRAEHRVTEATWVFLPSAEGPDRRDFRQPKRMAA